MPDTSSKIIWGSPSVVVSVTESSNTAVSGVAAVWVRPASCQSERGIPASYNAPARRARASPPQWSAPCASQSTSASR